MYQPPFCTCGVASKCAKFQISKYFKVVMRIAAHKVMVEITITRWLFFCVKTYKLHFIEHSVHTYVRSFFYIFICAFYIYKKNIHLVHPLHVIILYQFEKKIAVIGTYWLALHAQIGVVNKEADGIFMIGSGNIQE